MKLVSFWPVNEIPVIELIIVVSLIRQYQFWSALLSTMFTLHGGTDLIRREMFVGVGFLTEAQLLWQLRAYENVTFRHLIIRDSHRNPSDLDKLCLQKEGNFIYLFGWWKTFRQYQDGRWGMTTSCYVSLMRKTIAFIVRWPSRRIRFVLHWCPEL